MAGLVPAIHGLFPKGIAIRTYPTIARTYRTIVTTSRTIFLFLPTVTRVIAASPRRP
jgi:hypothetical protein